MPTCKNCKWWDDGRCDIVNTLAAEKPETLFDIVVTVADDHNLNVYLRTGPDFGCVLHSPNVEVNS